ncbi:MAG: hypothetical protein GC190_21935 [Alphaproteobacteria bacterium]|nr:hypothetical protein [Alphaproteobacteria bacterium]
MKNAPLASAARSPRGVVQINGTPIDGWLSIEVESTVFANADTFRVRFAVSDLPAGKDANWFSSQKTIKCEVFAGFPPNPDNYSADELDSLILGMVDNVSFDPIARTLLIDGRDFASKLIEAKISDKYPNQTSSQIATTLAGKAGLTPQVTSTSVKVGKFYEIDQVRLTDNSTQWDLLQYLAREEGFAAYVKGETLYFEPKPSASQDPYVFKYEPPAGNVGFASASAQSISARRNLAITGGLTVEVHSWNMRDKKAYAKTATSPQGAGKTYTYVFANLTPDQCQARANQLLKEITGHQMTLNVRGPADNILLRNDVIQLTGTGTAFDQTYFPTSIARSLSRDEGYVWDIEARNVADD